MVHVANISKSIGLENKFRIAAALKPISAVYAKFHHLLLRKKEMHNNPVRSLNLLVIFNFGIGTHLYKTTTENTKGVFFV